MPTNINSVGTHPASARGQSSVTPAQARPRDTLLARNRFLRWLGYDGSRPALLAVPLIVIPVAAFFFIRAALHPGEPHLQLIGHYAPIGAAPLQIGTGPEAAIRLTESEIDAIEGWLRPGDRDFTYDHAAPTSVVRRDSRGIPIERAVELGRHSNYATVQVSAGERTATIPLTLFDGCRLTLKTRSGDYSVTLPEQEGYSLPVGGVGGTAPLWLSYCGGHPVWSRSVGCTNTVPFGSYFAKSTGRIIDAAPPAGAPSWLDGACAVFGASEDNAYVKVGSDPIERVATPLQLELGGGARPFVVWKRGSSSHVFISRTAPPGVILRVTPLVTWFWSWSMPGVTWIGSKLAPQQTTTVGSAEHLPYGSVLVLGSTPFRVTRAGGVLRLTAVERRDRFHFFPTLSSGRINFTNRSRTLHDALALPARRLNVVGVAVRGAPPPVEPTAQGVAAGAAWALPLPRWMRPAGTSAAAMTDVALAAIAPSDDGGHVGLQTQTPSPLATHSGAVRDREEILLGGHVIRYAHGVPLLEQIAPPAAFSLIALLIVVFLTMRISASVPNPLVDLTPTVVVGCTTIMLTILAALLIGGVSLMSHMAAVDTLIGKSDYYHRQLFYSFIALAFAAAIVFPARESPNPFSVWRTFFPFSWRVVAACGVVLFAWQLADAAVWLAANGRGALDQDTIRDALFAGVVALSVAGAIYAAFDAVGWRAAVAGLASCGAAMALSYRGHLGWGKSVGLLVMVASLMALRRLAAAQSFDGQPGRAKHHRFARFILAHYSAPLKDIAVLGTTIFVLLLGIGVSSGRESAGVKPAEFAIWFLAIGLTSRLTGEFNPTTRSPQKRVWPLRVFGVLCLAVAATTWALRFMLPTLLVWTLPPLLVFGFWAYLQYRARPVSLGRWLSVIGFLTILVVVVTALYGGAGDFGPVLVLLPTVALVVLIWSAAPDTEETSGRKRILAPAAVIATLVWLAASGLLFIHSNWAAARLPPLEGSLHRASKRLVTFADPWYTKEGSWGVQAQWLANDFYGTREPMIANLQSDLAFVAALRTFGHRSASLGLLGAYFFLTALPIVCAWVLFRHSADRQPPPGSDTNTKIAAIRRRLRSREAALLLFFAAIYLSVEVLIHVGSGFNAVPQTGVTLPWISSGGSAAVAFAGLFAIAFAHAVEVARKRP